MEFARRARWSGVALPIVADVEGEGRWKESGESNAAVIAGGRRYELVE